MTKLGPTCELYAPGMSPTTRFLLNREYQMLLKLLHQVTPQVCTDIEPSPRSYTWSTYVEISSVSWMRDATGRLTLGSMV